MIELKKLSKVFESASGSVEALRDVDLTINDGEIFGIIGLSGAGKSTLVRCINLLERPSSGQVIIDGRDMTSLSPPGASENAQEHIHDIPGLQPAGAEKRA